MNVIMIRNGCMWVCMGTSGCTNTNLQANKTKKDRNRVAGYDSRPCMDGKFPPKDTYVCTDIKRQGGT